MNHLTSPDHVAWPVEVALEVSDPQVYSNEAEWDVKKAKVAGAGTVTLGGRDRRVPVTGVKVVLACITAKSATAKTWRP